MIIPAHKLKSIRLFYRGIIMPDNEFFLKFGTLKLIGKVAAGKSNCAVTTGNPDGDLKKVYQINYCTLTETG